MFIESIERKKQECFDAYQSFLYHGRSFLSKRVLCRYQHQNRTGTSQSFAGQQYFIRDKKAERERKSKAFVIVKVFLD